MHVRWTIGRRLYTGVGALVVLLLGAGLGGQWIAQSLKADLDETAKVAARRLELALMVADDADDVKSAERRFLIAAYRKDTVALEAARQEITEEIGEFQTSLRSLRPLLDTADQTRSADDAERALKAWMPIHREVQQLIDARRLTEGSRLSVERGAPLLESVDAHTEAIEAKQRGLMDIAIARGERQYTLGFWLMIGVQVLSFLIAGYVVYSVYGISGALRQRASALRDGAEHVVAAATQVSGSSQSLSQGANEQAASLEETSASMEEMASMTRQNAENSHQAAGLMTEVDRRVSESNDALAAMVSSMSGIQESSAKVAKIIKTIDEIAFQTNILALNAAVEAARAGQAGAGFAVVADEVRSLAQRSAQAARDTAVLIEESGVNAAKGSHTVEQVAQTIAGITESVGKVKGLVDQVSVASRQQAQGIDQVTQSIAQMEKVTQTTAATAEESAAASEELNAQAETALGIVTELEGMVGADREPQAERRASSRARREPASVAAMRPRQGQGRGARPARAVPVMPTAEDLIPLESGTGTYGRF